jgi:hypothetical protein
MCAGTSFIYKECSVRLRAEPSPRISQCGEGEAVIGRTKDRDITQYGVSKYLVKIGDEKCFGLPVSLKRRD